MDICFYGKPGFASCILGALTWKSKAAELAEPSYPVYFELLIPLSLFGDCVADTTDEERHGRNWKALLVEYN